jgi:hypothetical protein
MDETVQLGQILYVETMPTSWNVLHHLYAGEPPYSRGIFYRDHSEERHTLVLLQTYVSLCNLANSKVLFPLFTVFALPVSFRATVTLLPEIWLRKGVKGYVRDVLRSCRYHSEAVGTRRTSSCEDAPCKVSRRKSVITYYCEPDS